MATEQIEVYPDGEEWFWRLGDETSDAYPNRTDAIAGARERRGDELVELVRQDGTVAGTARLGGRLRVALMRPDGTEYGELDPAAATAAESIRVMTLVPVTEEAATNG